MNIVVVPIIIILCYLVAEGYKILVRKNEEKYRYIPLIVGVLGGALGIICFLIDKSMLLNVSNVLEAFTIGIISGLASTGSNQVIKQLLTKIKE